ncbi:hypothetical protein [Rhodococcus sp. 27YEA15]|uniref:hypothetical protein n=1 Tax=Rhodococcus sp. 27YEA15 TaxID=3156259 RepID=UPI003C7D5C40
MGLTVCTDVAAANWLIRQPVPWHHLAVKGPIGFPSCARLRFLPDPAFDGQRESAAHYPDGGPGESEQITVVLETLSAFTTTPDDCYFCFWDGWGMSVVDDGIPMVTIPNRSYWLFRGAPTCSGDLVDGARFDPRGVSAVPDPAFIWPADHAWCYTHDVDPHFAIIAGPTEAIDLLVADPRIDAVTHDLDVEPLYFR